MRSLYFLLFLLFFISGCSTKGTATHQVTLQPYKIQQDETPTYKLKKQNAITLSLYEEYLKWEGTPNVYGGYSFKGIDCSALVQSIYRDAFGVYVPRTTKEQSTIGYRISKELLQEGDLVLFKTGYNTRHSGIYLENGNFIHSSSKYGVTLSSIHNPYWKSKYSQSRRVLP